MPPATGAGATTATTIAVVVGMVFIAGVVLVRIYFDVLIYALSSVFGQIWWETVSYFIITCVGNISDMVL